MVPSVNPHISRLGALAVCGALLAGAVAGCSTTQEKADAPAGTRPKRILKARKHKGASTRANPMQKGKEAMTPTDTTQCRSI